MSSKAPDPRQSHQPEDEAIRDKLLDTTGLLLEALGVDRLTTSIVAQCAGIAPPKFYQYFSDKYELLQELGDRLHTQLRNQIPAGALRNEHELLAALKRLVRVNRNTPGGPWVLRMLRCLPQLAAQRAHSNTTLANILLSAELARDPTQDPRLLANRIQLAVGMGYAAIDLVIDQPDLDEDAVFRDVIQAIRAIMA